MDANFEAFTVLISRISRSIKRIKTEEMAEFQLKGTHVSCLYYLYLSDSMTAAELCERTEEDKAALSRSLEYLEAQGYLTGPDKGARRYKYPLHLTKKGRAVGQAVADKVSRIASQASCDLTETEREIMYRSLGQICARLEAMEFRNERKD